MAKNLQELISQDIFEVMQLEHLPQEKREELFQKAYETIMNRVLLRLADHLGDEKLGEFKEKLETKDTELVEKYLAEAGIELDQIVAQESLGYKAEMAALTETLRGQDSEK